jgi:signal transduction histidine kinase
MLRVFLEDRLFDTGQQMSVICARRQPNVLFSRLARLTSWPAWRLMLALVSGGLLLALLDEWVDTHLFSWVHHVADFLVIGVAFPLFLVIVAHALVRVRRGAAAAQARAVEEERRRISRDPHDSIAQQIGYLHLKLDSMAGDDALAATAAIRHELEQMRVVSSEAYDQIYGILTELRVVGSTTLAETLLARAKWVGSRAGFEVSLAVHGEPCPLRAESTRQILFIFREALNNVEKHAGARRVNIEVAWQARDLAISLRDDGSGFIPAAAPRPSHFGLGIMRERADRLGGTLTIESRPGWGTVVRLRAPLDGNRDEGQPRGAAGSGVGGRRS